MKPDLICLSHLRWPFVFQRPHHLMARFAQERRVFWVEEPAFDGEPGLELEQTDAGVTRVVMHVREGDDVTTRMRALLDRLLKLRRITRYVAWHYSPTMLEWSRHLRPEVRVHDCMDELSLFHGAPPRLLELEAELFRLADVVFTGGHSLYEHKRLRHHDIHAFPSSVDVRHFGTARATRRDPPDQAPIPHPRLGFFGVIDERFDAALIAEVASLRPDWQLVLVGPVVKIDPATLPVADNLHYLGNKSYTELPAYLSGWDVALLPFAKNDATRFISPTKTPEYLAAGRPVVSTSIRDVVRPYGEEGLVEIADDAGGWVAAIERCLSRERAPWLAKVDKRLATESWDLTFSRMRSLMERAAAKRKAGAWGEA